MPIHDRIKQRRHVLGISLETLADRLRPYWPTVTRGALSRIENGDRAVPVERLRAFAKALECEPTDLLDPLP